MKKLLFLVVSVISFLSLHSQSEVKWYSMEEAIELQKKVPKPIFVDIYTDWCGWCKKMDVSTFKDPNIVQYLNNNFYAVKLDAETTDTINYFGKPMTHPTGVKLRGNYNALAVKLLNGRASFPTTAYIMPDQKSFPVPGYQDAKKLQPLLVWVAERVNEYVPYDQFLSSFNNFFYKLDTVPYQPINWMSMQQALDMQKKQPKKILIFLEADWVFSARLMNRTLGQPEVATYLNDNYYCVKINATSKEAIEGFGQTWTNDSNQPSIHPLVAALLDNKLKFPGLIWMNEDAKKIHAFQSYAEPDFFLKLLHYFGKEDYLNIKWQDYSID